MAIIAKGAKTSAEKGGLVKCRIWGKPLARAICAQGVASSAFLIQERVSLAAVGGRVVERCGAPLQSNFSAQVKDREINRNKFVFRGEGPLRRVLEIASSARPRSVKHA